MYLNCNGICKIVSTKVMNVTIERYIKESDGYMIIALVKDSNCFIVNKRFNDKQSMIKEVSKYALEGYKVITNEDNRRNKS